MRRPGTPRTAGAAGAAGAADAADAADAGETLVELLVTVVILGIATAGLAGALLATNSASQLQRQQVLAQNALRSWAEQVAAGPYTDCAPVAGFAAPAALPGGLTAAVTAVRYWDGTAFVPACGPDTGVQRVTLRITAAGGGLPRPVVQSLAVVVRKPCVAAC